MEAVKYRQDFIRKKLDCLKGREMAKGQGGSENNIIKGLVVAVLLVTLICLVGTFAEENADTDAKINQPASMVTAAGTKEKPQIVNGFVPERHHGLPPPKEEAFFLSWDFVNALFAIILLVEFIVFPFLFWLWFGHHRHTENK